MNHNKYDNFELDEIAVFKADNLADELELHWLMDEDTSMRETADRIEWCVFGHLPEGGREEIAQFSTKELAEFVHDSLMNALINTPPNGLPPSGEHLYWDRQYWREDVHNGDTKLGYWAWVNHNIESSGDNPNES